MAGEDPAVRVQFGRGVIVVSGSQMDIPSDAVLFPPHHQGNLPVGLKPHQSIDHMTACLFQHLCPDNVILLIKAGL